MSLGRVHVVDDDRSLCEALEAALRRLGYEPSWTTSPARTLDRLGAAELDVVVTDLHMPEMTGLELCARIVAERPDVPVVVMTALGDLDTAVVAARAGAYAFLPKPIDFDALARVLGRAMRQRRLLVTMTRRRRRARAGS